MTRAQALRLKDLAEEAYQPGQYVPTLSFEEAARRIDTLKAEIALADSFKGERAGAVVSSRDPKRFDAPAAAAKPIDHFFHRRASSSRTGPHSPARPRRELGLGPLWAVCFFSTTSLAQDERLTLEILVDCLNTRRNEMVAATRELPASGYALEVDGRLKTEFVTRDGARAGAEELKKRFPMLQVRIYDAQTKIREEIQPLRT